MGSSQSSLIIRSYEINVRGRSPAPFLLRTLLSSPGGWRAPASSSLSRGGSPERLVCVVAQNLRGEGKQTARGRGEICVLRTASVYTSIDPLNQHRGSHVPAGEAEHESLLNYS